MVTEGSKRPSDPELQLIDSKLPDIGNMDILFSPRFKSAAAMAGWDEEALLIASLVVDDTPERELRSKKRSDLQFKSPPTGSRRKRRIAISQISIPVAVLDLDEEETTVKDDPKKESEITVSEPKKSEASEEEKSSPAAFSRSAVPCMDKLREELSCAICLEICFEPSTTPCGHSFCKKCLRSAADKCGKKCPKCRNLISNGRSCTVNTVLWNTIQLLFPQEVEARRETKGSSSSSKEKIQIPEKAFYSNMQNQNLSQTGTFSRQISVRRRHITVHDDNDELQHRRMQRVASLDPESRVQSYRTSSRTLRAARTSTVTRDASRRGTIAEQDEDAALALRLQREEFMEAFRDTQVQTRNRSSLSLARANLRAMASRAINLRTNGRQL